MISALMVSRHGGLTVLLCLVFSIFVFFLGYQISDQMVSKLEVALFTETRLLARLQKNLIADNHEESESFFAAHTISLLITGTRSPIFLKISTRSFYKIFDQMLSKLVTLFTETY